MQLPTAGVSKHNIGIQLTINPEFFYELSESHRLGLIKHELLHIAFGHLIMRDLYADKKLFNIVLKIEWYDHQRPSSEIFFCNHY